MKWMLSLVLAALIAVPNAQAQDEDRAAELRRAKAEIEKALREVESAMKQLEKIESVEKGAADGAIRWRSVAPKAKAKKKAQAKSKAKKKMGDAEYFFVEGKKKGEPKKGKIRRFFSADGENGASIQLETILEDVTEELEDNEFPALVETLMKSGDKIIQLRKDGNSITLDGPLALLLERSEGEKDGGDDCDGECCDEGCCDAGEGAMMKRLHGLLGHAQHHGAKAKSIHRFLAQIHGGEGKENCPALQHPGAHSILRMAPHLNLAVPHGQAHALPPLARGHFSAPTAPGKSDRGLRREVKELRRRVARLEKLLGDRGHKGHQGRHRAAPPAPKAPARPKAKQRKWRQSKKSLGHGPEVERILLGALAAPESTGITRIAETEEGIRLAIEPQIESRDQVILQVKPIAAPAPTKRHRL